jgi:hypothetical protein
MNICHLLGFVWEHFDQSANLFPRQTRRQELLPLADESGEPSD